MNEMMMLVIYCAILGAGVGFLAGLLGIGGGLVIVPILSSILAHLADFPPDQVVIIAVATSLASILFTSTSSALAHHKNGNVPWQLAPWIMTGVALGALISGFMAALLPDKIVRIVFVVSVVLIALKMFLSSIVGTVTDVFLVRYEKSHRLRLCLWHCYRFVWIDRLYQLWQRTFCLGRWLCGLCLFTCTIWYCVYVVVYRPLRCQGCSHLAGTFYQKNIRWVIARHGDQYVV